MTHFDEEFIKRHQAKVHADRDKRNGIKNNRGASQATNLEHRTGNEPQAQDETKEALPPVVIVFTHRVRKPRDSDASVGKWYTDAIVEAGILRDDSLVYVKETRHRHVIIESWETECTVIELVDAESIGE